MPKTKKERHYVVWRGREPGIYHTWDDCKRQVEGCEGALYKGFSTADEAEEAYYSSPHIYIGKGKKAVAQGHAATPSAPSTPPPSTAGAIAVDAACSGNPGAMEYRGVEIGTRQELFHFGPTYGTNNIGEFLAIVHALALLRQQGITRTIYSDSRIALGWVRRKKCATKLERTPRTEELHRLIERAERWLNHNSSPCPVLKWHTEEWGEIPADFGRK